MSRDSHKGPAGVQTSEGGAVDVPLEEASLGLSEGSTRRPAAVRLPLGKLATGLVLAGWFGKQGLNPNSGGNEAA